MGRNDSAGLGLVDLMLLVAGCAASLAASIFLDDLMNDDGRHLVGLFNRMEPIRDVRDVVSKAEGVFAGVASLIGAWVMVLPLIGFRHSRSVRKRLFRRPGLTACLAVWAGIGV